jgi:hypothetical protein
MRLRRKKEALLSLLVVLRLIDCRLAQLSGALSVLPGRRGLVRGVLGELLGDAEPDFPERLRRLNTLVMSLLGVSTSSRSAQ